MDRAQSDKDSPGEPGWSSLPSSLPFRLREAPQYHHVPPSQHHIEIPKQSFAWSICSYVEADLVPEQFGRRPEVQQALSTVGEDSEPSTSGLQTSSLSSPVPERALEPALNPFVKDPPVTIMTNYPVVMHLYHTNFPHMTIRQCFYQVYPNETGNFTLFDEHGFDQHQTFSFQQYIHNNSAVVANHNSETGNGAEPLTNIHRTAEYRNDPFFQEVTVYERLGEYKGSWVAVEAKWYLQLLLDSAPAKEPLVSALGGLPFALKSHFEADLEKWKKAKITPVFVFEGLSLYGEDEISLRIAREASTSIKEGWDLYTGGNSIEAVRAFGGAGAIRSKDFFRFFQSILDEHKLPYEIAAYSAASHIAEMDKNAVKVNGDHTCELVMGSLELLFFPITTSIITKIDFEEGNVYGIHRDDILQKLNVTEDVFIDALLMTGTSFLPTFPALKDSNVVSSQPYTVKDAVNMYRAANKSTIKLCEQWGDILQKQEPDWLDRYRRARLAIKHNVHVAYVKNNWHASVVVSESQGLTGDHHEYIGLQLPQELYHYMIHGAIGPRSMNWLVYLKMVVPPPLDGGDSTEYRQLITSQLVPLRAQTIALYTSRMHRAFQHKDFSMSFWFDAKATVEVNHQAVQPAPNTLAGKWCVTEKEYEAQLDSTQAKPGSITFALSVLEDEEFAAASKLEASGKEKIKSHAETMANTVWRFLQLRGYIGENHQLTTWGKALLVALKALNPLHKQEEAALLAFELLRLDQLNTRNPHKDQIGAPQRGSDEDKTHCLLISRCASLLKIRHKDVGYTGPLSKNLLAYHSIVSAVRETDRDLIEAVVASMFLFADGDRRMIRDVGSDATRKRKPSDWRKIGFSLPFGTDIDVALGIAVKTWLDDHVKPGMKNEEKEQLKKDFPKDLLPHGEDFSGDLDMAFSFFNAVFDGVNVLKDEIAPVDFEVWGGARKYLSDRR